ncbi:hypothetical protein [Nocardioides sp.]
MTVIEDVPLTTEDFPDELWVGCALVLFFLAAVLAAQLRRP